MPSTPIAEFIAIDKAARVALALMNLLLDLELPRDDATVIYTHSHDAYLNIYRAGYVPGRRWINAKYDFVKEYVAKGLITVAEVAGADNPADGFTIWQSIDTRPSAPASA